MKKIYIKQLTLCVVSFLLMTSCSDFLTEKPGGTMEARKFFATKDGYEYMVKGMYEPVRYVTRNKSPFILGTDAYTSPGRGVEYKEDNKFLTGFNEYYKAAFNSENGDLYSLFADSYNLIQRANSVIAYGKRAAITTELRDQRAAEAKYLRALCYYYLVEQFSDVPLLTAEITSPELTAERTPEKDIYSFIIKDLEDSYNSLAPKNSQSEFGRVTRGASKMLLSKLYLTRAYKSYAESGDAKKAYDLSVDVIENEGYRLLPDFADIFKEGNEINDEIIFSVQYSTDLVTNWGGNTDYSAFQPHVFPIPGMGAKAEYSQRFMGSYAPTRAVYRLFDRTWDSRFDKSFQREYYANEKKDQSAGVFGAANIGDLLVYVTYPDEPMSAAEKATKNYFVVNFDEYYDVSLKGGKENGSSMWYAYPGIKKFFDSKALYNDGGERGTRDHFEFRLGEVYLIAAEASLKAGTGDGSKYLRDLRNRSATGGSAPAITLTIDNILDERARELIGEERRFLELKRTGKLRERVITKKMNERAVVALEVFGDNAFKDEYINRPLPYNWTRYLQNIINQNPGYDY
ncbi:putative outer membrane starch-binding protein [Dysgonomonas alginatilytica]|uniref:Putative outer membrane starch-binding protein n=1 Tax=Dysgonomonas alginatilytica TaxID=1605892 RepID=A0A2V3PIS8_9BACT|nr:RagB/SusD family nutrient uptake outer membrane protein [Dysgonomonas alginatilytica]PXV59953.1 putative outer membrane starch-binding protein [Dysgonomonas alginatilytica]